LQSPKAETSSRQTIDRLEASLSFFVAFAGDALPPQHVWIRRSPHGCRWSSHEIEM
jgi:hypothetical protein